MLYLIGLGLGDAKDITMKGFEIVKKCETVYLEAYTSLLTVGKENLENFYGKEIIIADREMIEQDSDSIFKDAVEHDIALLVVGDPFGATTHTDLVLRAVKMNIPYKVVHNASILNAVGCCGLELYRFGETVSIVFWTPDWKPESFVEKIMKNKNNHLHTLCLLDLKIKEQSIENIIKEKKIYEPPRFMTVACAAQQLLEIIVNRRAKGEDITLTEDSVCVGLARIGSDDQKIVVTSLQRMSQVDIGKPLQSLIICGDDMHFIEVEMLRLFAEDKNWFDKKFSL